MRVETLKFEQVLNTDIDTAWAFFSDPRNLARITPPEMGFAIQSELPDHVYSGLIIRYTVRPLLGIPVTWITEIKHVEEGRFFVDEQRAGPYKMWHHQHHFEAVKEGVRMTDEVNYAIGFGPLDRIISPLIVRPKVKAIFAYREKVIKDLLPTKQPIG
ncbi:MAG: SRPBCC family protein [Armatimonadetes bacterium]|nr:SRPBCC family protein [Armatimonadota bacterium]